MDWPSNGAQAWWLVGSPNVVLKKPSKGSGKQEKQEKQEGLSEKHVFTVITGRRVRRRSRNSPPVEDPKKADKDGDNEEDEDCDY